MRLNFLILLACAFFFYGCPGECSSDGYDEVHIVSTVELDTIVSNISSYESCFEKPFCYQFKIKEDYADSVQLNAFAFDDTLQYLIKHKKWSDIYIVVDTIPIESCKHSFRRELQKFLQYQSLENRSTGRSNRRNWN